MLIETIKKYKDGENGKVYEIGDIREVETGRAKIIIAGGVAAEYAPKSTGSEGKGKGKGGKAEKPSEEAAARPAEEALAGPSEESAEKTNKK